MVLESTTRDALLAEILGDIGRLHDSVNLLTNMLPTQAELVETKITGLIGLLQLGVDLYEKQIKEHTNTNAATVRLQMESDVLAAIVKFERTTSEAVQAVLKEVESTAKQTIKNEVSRPTQKALESLQLNFWKTLGMCLASGVVGSLVVTAILHIANIKI